MMMYEPSMMVLELLRKICERDSHLLYTPAEYAFTLDGKDEVLLSYIQFGPLT